MVIRKKVLSESSHRIGTNLNMIVEFIEVQISVAFELFLCEEIIEFW